MENSFVDTHSSSFDPETSIRILITIAKADNRPNDLVSIMSGSWRPRKRPLTSESSPSPVAPPWPFSGMLSHWPQWIAIFPCPSGKESTPLPRGWIFLAGTWNILKHGSRNSETSVRNGMASWRAWGSSPCSNQCTFCPPSIRVSLLSSARVCSIFFF